MKKRTLQLLALAAVLVIVLAVGIWFLTRQDNPAHGEEKDHPDASAPASTSAINNLTDVQVQYEVLEKEVEDMNGIRPYSTYDRFWMYEGQVCRFVFNESDWSFKLVSMETEKTLKEYGSDCFPEQYAQMYLDTEGNLWTLKLQDEGKYRLRCCESGKTEQEDVLVDLQQGTKEVWLKSFAVWENYLIGYFSQGESQKPFLTILDRESNTVQTIENVIDFCIDGDGNLYVITLPSHAKFALAKHSLKVNEVFWTQDLPFLTRRMWCADESGLFLLGGYPELKVMTVDTETGEMGADLLNFWTDTDIQDELNFQYYTYYLGVSSKGNVYMSVMDYDLSTKENRFCERITWRMNPYIPEVEPADTVTLTITAPYPVDSIIGSVRMYQREHPEVQVVWDTQFASRDEYQKNAQQYNEQIVLRTTTGDVGDIQMIVGAGISQDVITDTDAFTDLSTYLYECPFKEELEWNMVEALRGEDGAIRAVPLGNIPQYFIYNGALLEKLGSPIDTNTVTWSQLLDLALEWKKDGTDLSLTSCSMGEEKSAQDAMLTRILLANLYGFELEDGSVNLDQPYFRELLTKLKELWGTKYLIRTDGNHVVDGFFEKSLYTAFFLNETFESKLGVGFMLREDPKIHASVAPMPWGEEYKKQQGYAFCWGIPASSKQKDAAWDLLEFIISKKGLPGYAYSMETDTLNNEAQQGRFMELIAMESIGDSDFFAQTQSLRKLPISRFEEPYGWRDAVMVPIKDYLEGNSTLDEAIKLAQDNWERFLKG